MFSCSSSFMGSAIIAHHDSEGGLSLSAHDSSVIRKTWDQARRDGDVPPQILFRLIKAHPEYQKMFTKFASVPPKRTVDQRKLLCPGLDHFGRFERRHPVTGQPGADGQQTQRSRRSPSVLPCYSHHVRGLFH
jgi:hypothetical protein